MSVYSLFGLGYAIHLLTRLSHKTQRKLGNNMLLGVSPNPGLKNLNSGWQVLLSPPSAPSAVLPAHA